MFYKTDTWALCCVSFLHMHTVFVPAKSCEPCQMFASKARAYTNEALLSCFTLEYAPATYKHQTKLERPARVKQSSLLQTFLNARHV
jgi:hypothetical protein